MPKQGDIFDLGTNEYLEYIKNYNEQLDYVIFYTRQPAPSLAELKVHTLIPINFLDGEYRKIGPNEKNRLAAVYRKAEEKFSKEIEAMR